MPEYLEEKFRVSNALHAPHYEGRNEMVYSPPVLVAATQSKQLITGLPSFFSNSISIVTNTRPLMPPPSRHSKWPLNKKKIQVK